MVVQSTEITRCEFPITFANSWIYPADLVFFGGGQSHCDAVRSAFHVDVALVIYLKINKSRAASFKRGNLPCHTATVFQECFKSMGGKKGFSVLTRSQNSPDRNLTKVN